MSFNMLIQTFKAYGLFIKPFRFLQKEVSNLMHFYILSSVRYLQVVLGSGEAPLDRGDRHWHSDTASEVRSVSKNTMQ